MAEVELIYDIVMERTRSKKIRVPKKHYELGIVKQRREEVVIGYFLNPPSTHGYGKSNYIIKVIKIPWYAIDGSARLKVGSRIISKAS